MNFLPQSALDAVIAYDFQWHVKPRLPNRTRFYSVLLPSGQDVEVHTVACKAGHRRGVIAKEVVRASVDDPFLYVKDLAFMQMAGYVIDWSPEKIGEPRPWTYRGKWESESYGVARGKWKINGPVINPEALQAHPRFRYCAWTPECGYILDYLKVFAKHPRVELLSKAGAGCFGRKVGFVAQMERDRELARFFLANLETIKASRYGVNVIRCAYRFKITLDEANNRVDARRRFLPYGLPREVDATRAWAYVAKLKCHANGYTEYLRQCRRLGLSLTDTKVTFPRQFSRRQRIVADRVAEMDRRLNAEKAAAMDKQLAVAASRFAHLERARAFTVVIPRRCSDLVREGKRLHNCLGDGHYAAKMARGETLVAFVRQSTRPGAAFVAVEYSPDQKRVLQCYAAKNQRPQKPVLEFVERWFVGKGRAA